MIIKSVWLSIIFALVNVVAFSQLVVEDDPYVEFDNLNVKSGLSNNYILDIFQDTDGYLWIATRYGLNRYDGYDFKVFKNIPEDSASITSDIITSIAGDGLNNLWFGTKHGLNKYDRQNDCFYNYTNPGMDSIIFKDEYIHAILCDSSNILWVENTKGELIKLKPDKEPKIYKHRPPTMVNTYFYHTIVQNQNQLWLGGRYMGLIRFDIEKETFYQIQTNPDDTAKKRDDDVGVYFSDWQGTFWVGGTDGLYTFEQDGEIFSKKLSISTFSICEDKNQNLYCGTGDGLYILDKNRKKFRRCIHDDNNAASIIGDHINKVFIDRSGNIWIGTTEGMSVFRPSKNKFKHIYHIAENDLTPTSNHATVILQDNKGRIWYGTASEGLEVFTHGFQKTAVYSTSRAGKYKLASDRVSTLMQDQSGDVWIGQWSGRGFNIVNPDKNKNQHFRFLKNSLKADWYSSFLEDHNGNFWIGIWGARGLYKFNKESGEFLADRYYASDYSNMAVRHLAFDGKYVWFALNNQSRFYNYNTDKRKFQSYFKEKYSSYEFSKILDISAEKQNVFFVTDNGTFSKNKIPFTEIVKTLQKPEQNNFEFQKRKLEKDFRINKVNSILNLQENVIWVASNRGLYKIADNKIEEHYSTKNQDLQSFPTDTIWDITFQEPDKLWLGTENGIVLFDLRKNTFQRITYQANKYLSSRLTSFLFEDSKGFIWIGTTDNGLNRLDPNTEEILNFIEIPEDSSTFWGNQAGCIFEDKTGVIWIGGRGINKFNPENLTFTHFTENNGLCHNDVKTILEDKNGNLWISTAFGLSKFNIEDGEFENFYEQDGLQDNEFSSAACKLSDGRLIFGGKNGINIFYPDEIRKNREKPEVKISGFRIFEKDRIDLLNSHQTLKLNYDQNYFSFDFVALDFSNPAQNLYAYKLEHFDDEWIYTTSKNRIARYTNVDPGSYTFCIKAANSDGIWNETGIRIPLFIKPPYWKTTWFIILEILLLVIIIIVIIKYREKKIIEKNQFQLLEQKLLRSQMNPHFIFNSLSSIQSFIFENDPIEAGSYLSRFAELIRSILNNSREEFITIEKEIKTLQNYLDLQQLRYNKKFDYILDVDPLIQPDLIRIPPMLAQPFIENAIEHGIKNLQGQGFISVSYTLMAEIKSVLLIIEDNGIGIKASKKLKSKNPKNHTSLSTVIANERIDIFNKGRKKKQFVMKIIDVKDKDGNVKGAKVKFLIPYREL